MRLFKISAIVLTFFAFVSSHAQLNFREMEIYADSTFNSVQHIDSIAFEYDGMKMVMAVGYNAPDSYKYLISVGETDLAEQMLLYFKPKHYKIKID